MAEKRYYVNTRFSGWREVTEQQYRRWCDHIRAGAVGMKQEERERYIQEHTRTEGE